MSPFMARLRDLMPVFALIGCLAVVIAAAGLWRLGSETAERACIERANARFPGVPVSAFVTRDRSATGPLKLSYIEERQKAVAACD
jgi:hypothetical protein